MSAEYHYGKPIELFRSLDPPKPPSAGGHGLPESDSVDWLTAFDDNPLSEDTRLSLLLDAVARPRDWRQLLTAAELDEVERQSRLRLVFVPFGIPLTAQKAMFELYRRGIVRGFRQEIAGEIKPPDSRDGQT